MTALQAIDRAREIDDQNRRMTGLVVSLVVGAFSAVMMTLALM